MKSLNKPIENIVFWGIVLQYAGFFMGLAPVWPLLVIWPCVLLWVVMVFRGNVSGLGGCVPECWFYCGAGILVAVAINFSLLGRGGSYFVKWLFSFGITAFAPLVGQVIRPHRLGRAAAISGILTLGYCAVVMVAKATNKDVAYQSPIPVTSIFPSNYHLVCLFERETIGEGGAVRAEGFCPYATYAGATGVFFSFLCLLERKVAIRILALVGWGSLVVLTRARTALIVLVLGMSLWYILLLPRKHLCAIGASVLCAASLVVPEMLQASDSVLNRLHELRASSSSVRHYLRTMAYDEWRFGEHPVLGALAVQPGGPLVAEMPVGSHDTIFAGLMVRGAMGLGLVLIPIVITLFWGLKRCPASTGRYATMAALAMLFYTYAENLEGLYMFIWPALLMLGRDSLGTSGQ